MKYMGLAMMKDKKVILVIIMKMQITKNMS